MQFPPTIGVALITYHAEHHLPRNLPTILASPLEPKVLVVDGSSRDRTVRTAREMGACAMVVPRTEFNHGATRELARKRLGTDIVVMMTQDAYPPDEHALGKLVRPIAQRQASLSYGRQVPHQGAGFLEAFPRRFNYPARGHLRSLEDAGRYGVYVFFSSDTFAAYDNAAMDEIGGFRSVLSHEDAVAAAMLLRAGHRIAYAADAVVEHSHRYTLAREFSRYWDAGYARAQYRDLFSFGGRHEKLGGRYARALMRAVLRQRPWLAPYAFVQTLVKWMGYKIGERSHNAPLWLKKRMSGQHYYWP